MTNELWQTLYRQTLYECSQKDELLVEPLLYLLFQPIIQVSLRQLNHMLRKPKACAMLCSPINLLECSDCRQIIERKILAPFPLAKASRLPSCCIDVPFPY